MTGAFAGDVEGTQSATSVKKIAGYPLDLSSAPSNGQSLVFDGANWIASTVAGVAGPTGPQGPAGPAGPKGSVDTTAVTAESTRAASAEGALSSSIKALSAQVTAMTPKRLTFTAGSGGTLSGPTSQLVLPGGTSFAVTANPLTVTPVVSDMAVTANFKVLSTVPEALQVPAFRGPLQDLRCILRS